jgi:3-isopropylmalate dehydrogenase
MMLRNSFDQAEEADLIEKAVDQVLAAGIRTGDIMTPGATKVSTTGMGDAVLKELDRLAA